MESLDMQNHKENHVGFFGVHKQLSYCRNEWGNEHIIRFHFWIHPLSEHSQVSSDHTFKVKVFIPVAK